CQSSWYYKRAEHFREDGSANAKSSTTIGKNLRPKYWDVEGSNKLDLGTTNDMNGERLKSRTNFGVLFVEGMQPTGFRWEFGLDPQVTVDMEIFEHRMRKLKMPLFEGEDAYRWIYRVEWVPETVMEATFTKGLKHALRTAVKVMNPEVRQTTSKGDNSQRMTELEIQDRKAKGLCFRCEEKYTPSHQCASRTLGDMSFGDMKEEATIKRKDKIADMEHGEGSLDNNIVENVTATDVDVPDNKTRT
nr:ankyrin repeat-containing protein [Tanacetum cinerariifolium]GEZ01649.1 ankyrin repeat-containing protein [Tanacetum cinerariifolium]